MDRKFYLYKRKNGFFYAELIIDGLVSEISSYKWKEDRDGNPLDEPVKFKDDAIAACRYAVEELDNSRYLLTDDEKRFFFGSRYDKRY